jgi:hypothetical protein
MSNAGTRARLFVDVVNGLGVSLPAVLHTTVSNPGAYILRETTGTNHVAETLRRAVECLAHWDIPHWVVGGLAVQEHGYYRVTIDVDIVVPDVLERTSS